VIDSILKLLQGIPSDLFLLDMNILHFYFNPEIHLNPYGELSNVSSFVKICEKFLKAGSYYL